MWAKTGPGTKTNWRRPSAPSLITRVPVMSAGIRSTVNCTRLKVRSSASASERTMSVLPMPGTPSISTWPPAKNAVRMMSMACSWPTTTRPTSRRTAVKVSWKSRIAASARAGVTAAPPCPGGRTRRARPPRRRAARPSGGRDRRAVLAKRRPRAGWRSPDDRPAFLLLARSDGVARFRERVGWRRHPCGPGAAFGALPRLVHTLAILTPQLRADELLELGRQARERGAVVVVGLDEGRGETTRPRPDTLRDGPVPFDCHHAVGGIATRGERGRARPEPRGKQQRQQEDADRGERAREGPARQAFRDEALGAPGGDPACVVVDEEGEERGAARIPALELEHRREPPLEGSPSVDPERRLL